MMRTGMLMIATMTGVAIMGATFIGLVGVALGGVAAVLVGAIRNYARVIRITGTPFLKIQQWNTIAVIVLAAGGGSIGAQRAASSLMADHPIYVQLSTTLALNVVLYASLLVVFRRGWLFAQFWRRRK